MSEWWTYRLSDFLMFSPATYWRLVERYNRDVWPMQLLTLAAGVVLLWLVMTRRRPAALAAALVLALAWAWVGWVFHWQRYAPVNWAARYFAAAFLVQAVLLLVWAVWARTSSSESLRARSRRIGLALAVLGLLYPVGALLVGRPLSQAEVFGVMPEPTALFTLGLLVATGLKRKKGLAIIPAASLIVGVLTLWMFRG
jgi:hypothetical protein